MSRDGRSCVIVMGNASMRRDALPANSDERWKHGSLCTQVPL